MSEYLARGLAPIVWVCQVPAPLSSEISFLHQSCCWGYEECSSVMSFVLWVWDNDWRCQIIYYFMIKLSRIGSYLQLLTTRCHQMHQPRGPSWEFTKYLYLWSSANFSEIAIFSENHTIAQILSTLVTISSSDFFRKWLWSLPILPPEVLSLM